MYIYIYVDRMFCLFSVDSICSTPGPLTGDETVVEGGKLLTVHSSQDVIANLYCIINNI